MGSSTPRERISPAFSNDPSAVYDVSGLGSHFAAQTGSNRSYSTHTENHYIEWKNKRNDLDAKESLCRSSTVVLGGDDDGKQ
jgi:hypothetical protein